MITLKNFILLLISLITASCVLNSQTSETNLQYKIQYAFSEKTTISYKMTYSTEVTRTYSDNSTKTFFRKIDTYLSFFRTASSNDGFVDIQTTFDSVNYEYKADSEHYKWSSITDDYFPTNSDFNNIVFPIVGRNYTSTLSPYFEIAKIEGKLLTETHNMIKKIKDTVQRRIWEKANSDNNLIFYSDMNKNVLKNGRYAVDSVWKSKFSIPIEGIRYTCDTAQATFYLYDGKNFKIKADMPQMYPDTADRSCAIGADDEMFTVDSNSTSKGSWDVNVSPRGMLNSATGKFETTANYFNGKQKFTDTIKTEIKYEFLKIK